MYKMYFWNNLCIYKKNDNINNLIVQLIILNLFTFIDTHICINFHFMQI